MVMSAETTEIKEGTKPYKLEIVWINVILFTLLYIGAGYGFVLKSSALWSTVIFAKILTILPNMAITGGAHRLWCHRTYKANTIVEVFFCTLACMTHQLSIYNWTRNHRMHHRYTDTDADPHNSKRGFFFCHIGWLMVKKHPELIEKGKTLDMSDLQRNKLLMFQHKLVLLMGIILPITVACTVWGENWKVAFFYLVLYRFVFAVNIVLGINSFAHMFGDRPYDKGICPTENLLMMITGFGEGFHNYHHVFPNDYRASEFGFDIRNPTTMLIDLFAKLGWASDRRMVPAKVIEKRIHRTGEIQKDDAITEWLSKYIDKNYVKTTKQFFMMVLFLSVMS